jgi:predicted ATPase
VPPKSTAFLRSVALKHPPREPEKFPFSVPAVRALAKELPLDPRVTFLIGENGTGKSTILEAIAIAAGYNAEGGSAHTRFGAAASDHGLHKQIKLVWNGPRPFSGFFLRAESFFNVATFLDKLQEEDPETLNAYGGKSLHQQSHGESFLALVTNRFGADGLYFLDEPEAALSPARQLALLQRMVDLVAQRCQFIVATHSPILLAFPGAKIYELSSEGIAATKYAATEHYRLTRDFLNAPERYLRHLGDEPAGE